MKSVLITGAGKGFGLELVKKHLYDAWKVFALPHHFSDDLENRKKTIFEYASDRSV